MNDEQLSTELRRRADAASARPDWSKRVLLPAVWREIDARPQPVVTSTLSPRLSLVAVVAALVILVVAVPRLTPLPPSATSSAAATNTLPAIEAVLSTAEFYALFATGELDGKSVLVDGRIGAREPTPGPPCEAGSLCYIGPLEGLPWSVPVRAASIPTNENPNLVNQRDCVPACPSWEWFHLPEAPIEGTLLLTVDTFPDVEFRGVLSPAQGSILTVPDALEVDIDSIGIDEVILVDGWLGDLGGVILDCDVPDPGDTVEVLPNRWCGQAAWLMDRNNRHPLDEVDRVASVEVQGGAYNTFGNDFRQPPIGPPIAAQGTYALARRLEGYCPGANPPCWLWTVVARVDSNPVVIPTSALAPSPTPVLSPPAPNVLECPQPIAEMPPAIRLIDHAEIVVACEGETDRSVPTGGLTVSTEGDGTLVVTWPVVLDNCTPMQSVLELWRDPRSEGNYSLAVRMSNPNAELADPGGPICDAATGVHKARIMLSQHVSPTAIHAFQTIESATSVRGSAMATADGVEFELAVSATKSTYSVGEAVEVSASLASSTNLTVSCLMSPIIALEQLDGPITFQPGPFVLMCAGPTDLRSATPVTNGFLPAVWALSEPHPLGPYIRDGKLYLPEGTYRFNATSSFSMGGLSSGARVQLDTSMVISVGGGFMVSPPILRTPSPTASPNLTIRERIDLYWANAGSVYCMGMLPPRSLDEVAGSSDVIAIGRPISAEPWPDGLDPSRHSAINFEVGEVLKGTPDDRAQQVFRVLNLGVPPGDLSEIDHLLFLSAYSDRHSIFYITDGYTGIYANVNGRVVTPEFAEIKREYGNSIFSVALDGTRFDALVERLRDLPGSATQRSWRSIPGGYFAC